MLALEAIADPTRRRIVEILAQGERSVNEIARSFSVSQPAISHHLQKLRKARLVRARVEAQRRVYTLDPVGFGEIETWVADTRAFWQPRLAVFESKLRQDPRPPRREP